LFLGESPPGAAGRLGMGLGITIIGILFIIEIVYFYRKYGCNASPMRMRQSQYELPSYHHRYSE
jgi:hypothetical protein